MVPHGLHGGSLGLRGCQRLAVLAVGLGELGDHQSLRADVEGSPSVHGS